MQADARSDAKNTVDAAQSGAAPGLILRAAREQQQLSVEDVAQALHLSHEIIVALEDGEFAALGPTVFLRGYLRNYARLLDLPQHLVLEGLPVADVEPAEFRTMSPKAELKPEVSFSGWMLWSLIGLILLVAAIVLLKNFQESPVERAAVSDPVATEEAAEQRDAPILAKSPAAESGTSGNGIDQQPAVGPAIESTESTDGVAAAVAAPGDEPPAVLAAAAETSPAGLPEGSAAAPASDSTVAPAETPAVAAAVPSLAAPADGRVALTLTFDDECWVEIADSRRSLLYGLEKAGTVARLDGVPPFKVFLGNRQAVRIELAGKPYVIPAGAPDAGNTTRFTIEEVQL